ncbi:hypothetical protein [Methylibium petroleiphilum]|uniref:hypothetical protein n=1 Tax=Methylibium petroleiphilum TaxID=105560 RepID=UPI003D2BC499
MFGEGLLGGGARARAGLSRQQRLANQLGQLQTAPARQRMVGRRDNDDMADGLSFEELQAATGFRLNDARVRIGRLENQA